MGEGKGLLSMTLGMVAWQSQGASECPVKGGSGSKDRIRGDWAAGLRFVQTNSHTCVTKRLLRRLQKKLSVTSLDIGLGDESFESDTKSKSSKSKNKHVGGAASN